ncbi:SH3 domain-containing protein [candidate division KSB1 bacterium]|nr:SH3 domain-containing protein [candidate division KSB1 bacterium]
MKIKLFIPLFFLALSTFFANTCLAQEGMAQPGAFLRMGAGAHAKSMGGAFTAIANSPAAAYWNPAGLAHLESISLLVSHNAMALDRTYTFVSGAVPSSRNSSMGISWIGLNVSNIEARSGDTSEPDYYFNSANSAFLLSYSYKFSSLLSLGMNFKWLQQNVYTASQSGQGFDLGLFSRLTDTFTAGLMVQDIGSQVKGEDNYIEHFPLIYRVGLAASFPGGLNTAVDFSFSKEKYRNLAIGIEYRPMEMLPIRAGFNQQGFVFGSGLHMPLQTMNLQFDYSYGQDPLSGSDVHTISVGVSYKPVAMDNLREKKNTKVAPPRKPLQYIVVQTENLNVREGPSANYAIIGAIHQGQKFLKVEAVGNWCKIQVGKKRYGWVHRKFIKEYIRR